LQSLNRDAQSLKVNVNPRSLSRRPELRQQAMQFVFRVEKTATSTCGDPTQMDRALMLIGNRREAGNP
jgi:hypothetical protein